MMYKTYFLPHEELTLSVIQTSELVSVKERIILYSVNHSKQIVLHCVANHSLLILKEVVRIITAGL